MSTTSSSSNDKSAAASVRLPVTILLHPFFVPSSKQLPAVSSSSSLSSPGLLSMSNSQTLSTSSGDSANFPTSPTSFGSIMINETTSTNSSEENLSGEDLEVQSVFELRNHFLEFVERRFSLANEFEIKFLFLEYFLDPVTEKVYTNKIFKNLFDVQLRLDKFCQQILQNRMAFDILEVEKQKSETPDQTLFYLKNIPKNLSYREFRHESLREFLHSQMEFCNNQVEQVLRREPGDTKTVGVLDEIQIICDMFLLELSDWFSLFEQKKKKIVQKWLNSSISNQTLPKYVLEIYKKKKEVHEKAKEYKFGSQDLNTGTVIENDWRFTRWMCLEHSTHWNVTFTDMPSIIQLSSNEDFSKENLALINNKTIGYVNASMDDVVKATYSEYHFDTLLPKVEYLKYIPINKSSSTGKYGAVLLNSKFDSRTIGLVISSKSEFIGEKMVENSFLIKSSDFEKNSAKSALVSSRIYKMVDKNRVRYVQTRSFNIGAMLNKNILTSTSSALKKLSQTTHSGLLNSIKEYKQNGFKAPDKDSNLLAKVLYDYCSNYCEKDLEQLYNNQGTP
ncbi:hypothetical protein NAEGRDRAFT_58619 [Naegleria gruberi]|uniref:Uncharacterized protein n=1 Tax=Naegleria gruberi TaxID=5762 RepID=D2VLQ2_NAEGR|nr:uncharacterized protein NAEGRDRAFT_58619 [Naegleria gruberi]EFC42177.1 hypothetical protein NAEGRDRAFT_58619 [Naegleria gruberi]|eukprot:XP_002674921.1 hypothetical protein NAEGRDRAFT_58619 [Naegleria gruberi strain NEG-M]